MKRTIAPRRRCPAREAARELTSAWNTHNKRDDVDFKKRTARSAELAEEAWEYVKYAEAALTWSPAYSSAGAAAQLLLAANELDTLVDNLPEEAIKDHRADFHAIRRLIQSAFDVALGGFTNEDEQDASMTNLLRIYRDPVPASGKVVS